MTVTVDTHTAKTQLSGLIHAAEQCEEVVIARDGQPVVCLAALKPRRVRRKPGTARGRIRMHDDFDAALPEDIAESFGS